MVESIKQFSVNQIPKKSERDSFWGSGDKYKILLKSWGIELDDYNKFWERFDSVDFQNRKALVREEKISLFPDVLEVLNILRSSKKKMGLVSNTAKDIVDFVIEKFNLDEYFHEIFALGDGQAQEVAKPSPAGIQTVLKKMGIELNEATILMIGDSAADITAAKRAKIKSCLIKRDENIHSYNYENWDFQPDYIIDSLREILQF